MENLAGFLPSLLLGLGIIWYVRNRGKRGTASAQARAAAAAEGGNAVSSVGGVHIYLDGALVDRLAGMVGSDSRGGGLHAGGRGRNGELSDGGVLSVGRGYVDAGTGGRNDNYVLVANDTASDYDYIDSRPDDDDDTWESPRVLRRGRTDRG